jgi:hypothetical protein
LLTQAMAGGIIEPRLGQPVLVGLVLTMARHASSPGRRPQSVFCSCWPKGLPPQPCAAS